MRIAIIGAGFSGMLAAYLLEQKGIDVTVFEKQAHIGGHCQTLSNNNIFLELGTVFIFNTQIKALFIELGVDFSERFTYRNFVDEQFSKVEHLSQSDVASLIDELSRLEKILHRYQPEINALNYGYIHDDLMLSLYDFLNYYELHVISQIIAPHLSSYGFGDIKETQAYYALNIFNIETIYSFIRGDKLLFINNGVSDIIQKLSRNVSDIRYAIEVINVEPVENQVRVETPYGFELYDKVLVTTKLPNNVIKDDFYNQLMNKIDTNPYITCAYEVQNKNIVTTYFKGNLGKRDKIQFFHTYKQHDKMILVAYAYGVISKEVINDITSEIEKTGVKINHLITARQWHIFPHFSKAHLTQNCYHLISEKQKNKPISFIGSLVSKPSLSNLYESVKYFIDHHFD